MAVTYSSTPFGKVPTVDYYADLPSASDWVGRIILVLNSSGIWLINYHPVGFYYSDGISWDFKTSKIDQIVSGVTLTDINGVLYGNGVNVKGDTAFTYDENTDTLSVPNINFGTHTLSDDTGNNTISMSVPDGGSIQLGQEIYDMYHNLSGVQLVNGDIVSIIGASGNRTAVTLCDATNETIAHATVGMVTVPTINAGQPGRITKSGKVRELNTSAYNEGDILYVDPANPGKWTATRPTGFNHAVIIGVVDVKSATVGVVDLILKSNGDLDIQNYVTKEPTGFYSPEDVVCTYNSGTRKVTLTGTVRAYWLGRQIDVLVSGWVSEAHDATNGTWFLYYDGTNFIWDTNPWTFEKLQIAFVYYGTSNKYALRECHGLMQWQSHKEFHEAIGTYRTSGGTLSGYTLSSTTASERRPLVSATTIYDEDLKTINPELSSEIYTQMYLDGGSNTASFNVDVADIVPLSGNQPYWNYYNGAAWTQVLMSNNYYAALWLIAMPSCSGTTCQKYRYLWLQPQSESVSLTTIQALNPQDVSVGTLNTLSPEFVFITKVIIRYQGANWFIVQVNDLTGNKFIQSSSPSGSYLSVVSHDATLSGDGTVSSPLSVVGGSGISAAEAIAYSIALG